MPSRQSRGTIRTWLLLILALAAIAAGIVLLRPRTSAPEREIVLYCAAGIQPPVDEIIREYGRQESVSVRVQYAGSGQLLSNIEAAQRGDLFLAADESYIQQARDKKLVAEAIPVATQRPVIVTRPGNPLHIGSLDDLIRPDVKIALANPDQAAIGRVIRQLLTPTNQWSALEKRAAVFTPTVNDLANDVKLGSVDAAIVWDTTAVSYPDLTVVHVPLFDQHAERITIGILTCSKNPAEALRFARFLAAPDKGLPILQRYGFVPVEGRP